ncbi:Rossmann-like and DUF2520 domain-containing protein [Carboxylicivirga sp. N1Y90]|uniref:Rossmann-like and DUF2520 domain-containing protein n=1 Tax=Carboxylicivirga fragile TaxID=3417571 RepID=UPI003D332EAE|nr:DUF2520 domain-containing protein [Marinilabiliaceae bacterium N1Y90]
MNIVLIGSGNVATQLGLALVKRGHRISQVFSRTHTNAEVLANKLSSKAISCKSELNLQAELYIVSVKDDALVEFIADLPELKGIVCHTAGSVDVQVLNRFDQYGVFYPFQTFTKEKQVDFKQVPILLEADNDKVYKCLLKLAESLSDKVSKASSQQRGQLHVAAVFACNFVNHMYRLSEDLLDDSGLSFELLNPLIKETADKVMSLSPRLTQTGPASRNDQLIIQKHMRLLKGNEPFESIYKNLTESILALSKSK